MGDFRGGGVRDLSSDVGGKSCEIIENGLARIAQPVSEQ